VGDSPGVKGIGVGSFHQKMIERQDTLPYSLNATSTHDTKRGEDTRIRLDLLSALPDEWIASVTRWRKINLPLIQNASERRTPTLNDEYFIYQSLLGGLPSDLGISSGFRERFRQYLTKALREAKTETNWEEPDEVYESACLAFADTILTRNSGFLEDFLPFAKNIIQRASIYSLSQLLIKLTAPGIPDIYQGAELWDLSFVDPDNRRPVNYDLRKYLLKRIAEEEQKGIPALLQFLSSNRGSGVEKLFVIQRTLAYRNRHPQVFTQGTYLPVRTADPHWIAYLRRHEKDWVLVVVPLIRKEWDNVRQMDILSLDLPPDAPARWKNEFTGQTFGQEGEAVSTELFAGFPVTLLSGIV
jgi:(1->4)-alpha-D-glucan 1-alpha-D-glucosylmutase